MSTHPALNDNETAAIETTPHATQAAARAVHETVDRIAGKAAAAEADLRKAAAASSEKLAAGQDKAKEKVSSTLSRADTLVRDNPLASIGIAFTAGALLTSLLRR